MAVLWVTNGSNTYAARGVRGRRVREIQTMVELLRIDEAARLLKVSRSRCYALCASGALPHLRLGPRALRIPAAALEDWIGRQVGPEPLGTRAMEAERDEGETGK